LGFAKMTKKDPAFMHCIQIQTAVNAWFRSGDNNGFWSLPAQKTTALLLAVSFTYYTFARFYIGDGLLL